MPRAGSRPRDGRRDPRRVRHPGRVGRPPSALLPDRGSRDVARPDDHRKDQLVRAVLVVEHLHVTDRDRDALAGEDVRDRLGKDVRPLLLKQPRHMAVGARGLIDGLRFLPALNRGANDPVTHLQDHVVHGGSLRQREDVHGLDLLLVRILELLGDLRAGQEPRDLDVHVGVLERKEVLGLALAVEDDEASLGLRLEGRGRRLRDSAGQRDDRPGEQDRGEDHGSSSLHGLPPREGRQHAAYPPVGESPFCYGKRSRAICGVLGSKRSSTYFREYASGFFEPVAWHPAMSRLPRYEGLLRQAPTPDMPRRRESFQAGMRE